MSKKLVLKINLRAQKSILVKSDLYKAYRKIFQMKFAIVNGNKLEAVKGVKGICPSYGSCKYDK